jgi:CRISPR-associated protein Csd1
MTVLQALDRYYTRLAERGDVVEPGWSVEPIGVVIRLNEDGTVRAMDVVRDAAGKKPKPTRVPKWFGRSGQGSTPYFLWDNTAYALGVSSKAADKTARDHAAFRDLHLRELADDTDSGLVAMRKFVAWWAPEKFPECGGTQAMLVWNVAFRLGAEPGLIHDRPAARAHVARLCQEAGGGEPVFCLVTGNYLPGARLHPKIKGVDGTASAEVPLVSFNLDAFESYGKEQGLNAPTSEPAAFRYGAALNRLLDRANPRNRIRIADATVAFWADASGVGEDAAREAEDVFALMFNPPAEEEGAHKEDSDAPESAKVRKLLEHFAAGRPMQEVSANLRPGTRFYVLGLAPNAARLSVRYWLDDSFESVARRLAEHYEDLRIEPPPWRKRLPAVWRLLSNSTALLQKSENIPPLLAGEVTRAVLTGTRYPRTLLAAAVMRLRAGDDAATGWHAAAIRACLARDARLLPNKEEISVSLNRDDPNEAYQLGRLFAMLETAQRLALGQVNATIRDRYFGAASAAPAGVFPVLLRGAQNHLGKLRKDGKGGWVEREIEEIASHLPPALPRSLPLEAQGRFAIGYYHQRRGQFAGRTAAEAAEATEAAELEGDDTNE